MVLERNALIQCTIREKAGNNFKINLPTKWVRHMGLSEDDRKVIISYNDIKKQIIIQK